MVIRNIKGPTIATKIQLQYKSIFINPKEELKGTEKELLKTECQLHEGIKFKD
jgi:hypothetical protein